MSRALDGGSGPATPEGAPHVAPYRPSEYGGDGEPIERLDTILQPYPLGWALNDVFSPPGFEAGAQLHGE